MQLQEGFVGQGSKKLYGVLRKQCAGGAGILSPNLIAIDSGPRYSVRSYLQDSVRRRTSAPWLALYPEQLTCEIKILLH